MLLKYSDNYFRRVFGIFYYNAPRILGFVVLSCIAVLQYKFAFLWQLEGFTLPIVPVSILGGALAIFLGFRNNSAYDRWWEARKVWGGIVNSSRTFGTFVMAFPSIKFSKGKLKEKDLENWKTEVIYRHILWVHLLRMHLRKKFKWEDIEKYVDEKGIERLESYKNIPSLVLNEQSEAIAKAYEQGIIEDFRHMEFANLIKELYTFQGQCERIKNTVFPYYYNYFTQVFLGLFNLCLPFALVEMADWKTIPLAVAISFVFSILDKSGTVTEDPFENRAADTPMTTISRSIEIDLLQMLGEKEIPEPVKPIIGKFGVQFYR